MGQLVNGRYVPESQDEIIDRLLAVAEEYWGEDLNDDEEAVVRVMYEPVAEFFAQMQQDIKLVLDSSQLEFATGQALDFLVELIGLKRKPALPALGQVTFSRADAAGVDYIIPRGTLIQNNTTSPVVFETTEAVTLAQGTTSIQAPITAVEPGIEGNVGPNVVTVIVDNLPGVTEVNNAGSITGGEDKETDINLRERAKDELNGGMKATPSAIINELKRVEGVKSVSLFINDSSEDLTASGGLPDHHFEAVVEGGADADVGQMIVDTKAVADGVYSGAHGTKVTVNALLSNGQTYTITFSRPEIFNVTLDADITIDDTKYSGDSFVQDSLVRYLGGLLTSGDEEDGELRVGADIIRSKVEHAIMDVAGVEDISNLTLYDETGSVVSGNVPIQQSEIATADATGTDLTITSTAV